MTNKPNVIGTIYEIGNGNPSGRGAVYDVNSIAPTILTMVGGGNRPMISENKGSDNVDNKKDTISEQYAITDNESEYESAYLNPDSFSESRITKAEYDQIRGKQQELQNQLSQYRVRKLTPTECYRLMGWQDKDIQKVKDIKMSDTQMYRQAGNGICVPCVELLFEHLYKAQYDENYECYDETFLKALSAGT